MNENKMKYKHYSTVLNIIKKHPNKFFTIKKITRKTDLSTGQISLILGILRKEGVIEKWNFATWRKINV